MTRISDNQRSRNLILSIQQNRANVDRYGNEVTTGQKVQQPGDSNVSGTVATLQETLNRVEGSTARIADVKSTLTFQDDVMNEVNAILIRAKEVATQAANTTNSEITRAQQAEEVFQMRDQLVNLANSTLKGRYIFGGAADNQPPYNPLTYVDPATGPASVRYEFDAVEPGITQVRTVQITNEVGIVTTTPANTIFDNAIQALERLGRAMAGYDTNPPTGAPDGTGAAFVFPADLTAQTDDIRGAIDLINTAREQDILPERVSLGGRLRRIESAESILNLSKNNAIEVLDRLQSSDIVEAASKLTLAQTALNASLSVTTQLLNQSILDFI